MSIQHKQQRVRPPRVTITYDVKTGGAPEHKELPFVIGVISDLSGHPEKPLAKLRDRSFVDVTPTNFDTVLREMQPRLSLRVKNTASSDENAQIGVNLKFATLEDFEPANVVAQVPALHQLELTRARLKHLANELQGNMDAEDNLLKKLQDPNALKDLIGELRPPASPGDEPEATAQGGEVRS